MLSPHTPCILYIAGNMVRWNRYDLFSLLKGFVFQVEHELMPPGIIDRLVQSDLNSSPIWQERSVFGAVGEPIAFQANGGVFLM